MGFLSEEIGTNNGRIFTLQCDQCFNVFIRKHKERFKKALMHFCSVSCAATYRCKKLKEANVDFVSAAHKKVASIRKHNPEHFIKAFKKAQQTIYNKYGVDNVSKSDFIKQKKINTSIEKYGCIHPMKNSFVKQKLLEVMKQNKSYKRISKIEYIVLNQLQEIYGIEAVNHQHPINGWAIDFYISSHDIYLQIDGIYWHGLIENMKLDNYRGKSIQKTMEKDKKQNQWFLEQQKTLIRYTDLQIKIALKNNSIKDLLSFNKETKNG